MNLPSAVIKISWKIGSKGEVLEGAGAAIGGVCGTCFSIEGHGTISASHHLKNMFCAHDGFDRFSVWVTHPDGQVHEIGGSDVEHFDGFDVSRISCPPSGSPFSLSGVSYEDVTEGRCLGYEASKAPFEVVASKGGVELAAVKLNEALLPTSNLPVSRKTLDVSSADVQIDEKRAFFLDQPATIGLSGGPLLEPSSGKVVGVCCIGLPADDRVKKTIGAVDVRDLLRN